MHTIGTTNHQTVTQTGEAEPSGGTDLASFKLNHVPAERVARYRAYLRGVAARGQAALDELPHRAVRRRLRQAGHMDEPPGD